MNATIATLAPDEIEVIASVRPEVNRKFLTIEVPNGWDDVKKLCKKVLVYGGERYTFSGWNSDTLKCFFVRPITSTVWPNIARIVPRNKNENVIN
jgi:hypothetical protein